MPSALIVKRAPATENSNGFFDILELGGLLQLLIQDAVISLDKTFLPGCGYMCELLGNCLFLQVIPNRMHDER